MEKLDKLMIKMNDKIIDHINGTTEKTANIVEEVFQEVKDFCASNGIPVNYDKINEIIEENTNSNYEIMKERSSFIVDCIDKEILEQEESKNPNKYEELDYNAFSKTENVDGKSTADDTQKVVDQLKSDLTEIKEHITSIAKSEGFKDEDIQYISDRIDQKIEGIEEKQGNVIYAMLRTDKDELIKETVTEYKNIEEDLEKAEKEQNNNSKGNDFRNSLSVKDQEGFSYEEQKDFSEGTVKKLEEIQKDPEKSLEEDVIE
ncbi:MAG: hypothetical protein J6M60_02765 [Clostridia bacterium]|nr:hypothetical protein [Clostridia bacterium]